MVGGWHLVGGIDSFPEAESRAVEIDGTRVCVIRADDSFYALTDVCTHGFALLSEGYCDVGDGVVECPLHGGLFDFRTGAAAGAPVERDTQVYAVKVEDGRVFVKMDPV